MKDVHIRLGQLVGFQPMDHMHPRYPAIHPQKAQGFLQPVAGQVRRRNNQGRQVSAGRQVCQGLDGFPQAHFIRQQAPVVPQQKSQALLLKGAQFPQEAPLGRYGALR